MTAKMHSASHLTDREYGEFMQERAELEVREI
jgi:hypothetical protein